MGLKLLYFKHDESIFQHGAQTYNRPDKVVIYLQLISFNNIYRLWNRLWMHIHACHWLRDALGIIGCKVTQTCMDCLQKVHIQPFYSHAEPFMGTCHSPATLISLISLFDISCGPGQWYMHFKKSLFRTNIMAHIGGAIGAVSGNREQTFCMPAA